jgi:hypothetical protein
VPQETATYALVQDVDRTGQQVAYAASLHSEVTFRSGAMTGALPVLVADVSLATDQEGRLPKTASPVTVAIGHVDGAPPTKITKATLEWRVNGDEAWQPLALTPKGEGAYTATFPGSVALAGRPIDVRVTAADTAGSTLTQTVTEATAVTK